jgi:hypothetical protein
MVAAAESHRSQPLVQLPPQEQWPRLDIDGQHSLAITAGHEAVDPHAIHMARQMPGGERITIPATVDLSDYGQGGSQFAVVRIEGADNARPQMLIAGLERNSNGQLVQNGRIVPLQPGQPVYFGGYADRTAPESLWSSAKPQFSAPGERTACMVYADTEGGLYINDHSDNGAGVIGEGREMTSGELDDMRRQRLAGEITRIIDWDDVEREGGAYVEGLWERLREDRKKVLFAPSTAHELSDPYDPNYKGPVVTEGTVAASKKWQAQLRYDTEASRVLEAHLGERWMALDPASLAAALRKNADLRFAMGSMYLNRLDEAISLPQRVSDNTEKRPNMQGYPSNLRSAQGYPRNPRAKEYAAVLALSHLDGTFDPARETVFATKPADFDELGWPMIDQHRAAARWAVARSEWQRVQQH